MTAEALRQSVLQRAMQGKLVPQDSSEEPASVLTEKIRREQKKVRGKSYVDSSVCKSDNGRFYERSGDIEKEITEDIPFEIPENWEWTRMELVAEFFTGNSISESEKKAKYTNLSTGRHYIGTKDVEYDHFINYDNGVRIPYEAKNFRVAPQGSVLLCIEGGSAGRKIAVTNEEVCFGNKLCCFIAHGIDNRFLYYYLQSPAFKAQFRDKTSGIIGGVSMASLKTMLVSIPPLAEQQRIVEALDKTYSLLDEYEKLEEESSKLDGEISGKLRTSILQYALQGKLVLQNPSDEPATVLLEQLKKEGTKKFGKGYIGSCIYKGTDDKIYERINEEEKDITDNISFDIPDTWSWARLRDIAELNPRNKADDNIEAGFIPMASLMGGYCSKYSYETKKWGSIKNGFTHFSEGDIVIAKITPCLQNRKSAIIHNLPNGIGAGTTELYVVRPFSDNISREYLLWFFKANYFIDNAVKEVSGTAGQQRVGKNFMSEFLIPLPPLSEQQRIVEAVDEAFAQVDALEASIKSSGLA